MNAYYGAYLFGEVAGDSELADFAKMLLATEIRSAQKYWQTWPGRGIYDERLAKQYMLGVVGALVSSISTWFGDNPAYVHGIQMMPFTPITEELLRASYVEGQYPYLVKGVAKASPPVTDAWNAIVAGDRAIVDRDGAWEQMTALDGTGFDGGTTKTAMLYWVATRP